VLEKLLINGLQFYEMVTLLVREVKHKPVLLLQPVRRVKHKPVLALLLIGEAKHKYVKLL